MIGLVVFLALFGVSLQLGPAIYKRESCYEYRAYCKTPDSNWDWAKEECKSMGGWLATFEKKKTLTKVRVAINQAGMNVKSCYKNGFWIGLNDPTRDGDGHTDADFEWVEPDPCGDYRKWEQGQPNDNVDQDPTGQNCVQLWYSGNKNFDDDYCSKRKGYICQFKIPC